jgi:hypothetical protein
MNYLFQVRGFADTVPLTGFPGFEYSGQTLPNLSETAPNETLGIGSDLFGGQPAAHFTRWYGPPNALDQQIQSTVGGRYATLHCDGTPITDGAQMVRVDGNTFSAPLDWNNNFIVPDAIEPIPWQDVNFNGSTANSPDLPFKGFNDGQALAFIGYSTQGIDLSQIGARAGAFGFSGGGGGFLSQGGGGFLSQGGGGFLSQGGGGFLSQGGGGFLSQGGGGFLSQGGGGFLSQGGGVEQDSDMANSTADTPTGLTAVQNAHTVVLNWTAPTFGQVRRYDIWRATGSFPTLASVVANYKLFSTCPTCKVTGTPPLTTFTDSSVKNNTTYTYFVTDKNKQGAQSGPSAPAVIYVKF